MKEIVLGLLLFLLLKNLGIIQWDVGKIPEINVEGTSDSLVDLINGIELGEADDE